MIQIFQILHGVPKNIICPGSEEEKLKFYMTSFSFCLYNSACPLQSLDHISHVVSESRDLQYQELEFISGTLVLFFAISQPLQTCLFMPVWVRHPPPHLDCCSHVCKTPQFKPAYFRSGLLGVYAQEWDCWVIWQFYFQFFKEISTLFSIAAVLVCIPTNSVRGFPFLHTLSSIYCLQTFGQQPS